MNENKVQYTQKLHIGYITFTPGDQPGIGLELNEICSDINGDENIYAVVISAKGDFFQNTPETETSAQDQIFSVNPAEAIGAITRPTLAELSCDAIGAGLEIALACDLRIGVETAKFGLPQIQSGHIPTNGGTQRLARLVGKGKALEMVLTGQLIDAREALEIGLVNKIVKAENLHYETETLAATLVAKAPLAVRYCKEAVLKGLDMTLEQGLRLEADLYFLLHTTSDRTEGVHSYWQKRKPEYKGK